MRLRVCVCYSVIQEPKRWVAGRASLAGVELASPLKGVCTPTVAGLTLHILDLQAPVDPAFEAFVIEALVKAFRFQVDFLWPRAGGSLR